MANSQPATPESSFENAITRLESIVDEMESDQLPLEELIVRYEEGIKLVKVCEERLQAAEKRIDIITKNAAGKSKLAPFEPEKKAAVPERGDVSLF